MNTVGDHVVSQWFKIGEHTERNLRNVYYSVSLYH